MRNCFMSLTRCLSFFPNALSVLVALMFGLGISAQYRSVIARGTRPLNKSLRK